MAVIPTPTLTAPAPAHRHPLGGRVDLVSGPGQGTTMDIRVNTVSFHVL